MPNTSVAGHSVMRIFLSITQLEKKKKQGYLFSGLPVFVWVYHKCVRFLKLTAFSINDKQKVWLSQLPEMRYWRHSRKAVITAVDSEELICTLRTLSLQNKQFCVSDSSWVNLEIHTLMVYIYNSVRQMKITLII